jgi:acetylornithine/succinyldiaminopimelate/putrescine aminotransferase
MLLSSAVSACLKMEDMGTTFGGGPLACAVVETVIDIIESEGLLANVQAMSNRIRAHCVTGPVTDVQGAGLLLGLRTTRPAKEIQKELMAKNIFAGTAADPHIVRLLPPYTLTAEHVDLLARALAEIAA